MLETAASQPNNVDSIRLENMATFSLNVLASGVSPVEATAQLDTITADPTTITAAEDAVITPTQTTQTVTTTIETAVPTPDTTPPTMASATVNSDGDIVITYNENVGGSLAEASDFVVTVDGATDAVLNASVDRYIVTLTMATKISGASTVNSIVYTAANGTPNSIQDVASNAAATQTLTTITNYSSYLTAAEAQAAYDFDNGATYLVADTAANLANPAVISAAALGQATDIGVTDTGTVTAADLNTIDNATTATISANSVTGVTGTSTEVITLLNSIITLNGSEAITLTDAANSTILAADLSAIDAATGAVTITNSVIIDGTADGASTADFIDVSGITFTSGSVTINGNDGNDSIIGGSEADIIDGGTGNDIIRGGAGVDTITGGADNDTLVVLGAIASGDYTAADVTTGTGAYALGLTDTIVAGVATSDSGVDGTGETYDGGAGTDSIEIWGAADLTYATISNINAINTHSDLTISATQLQTLFTQNSSATDLNLLDPNSTVNIIGLTSAMGMSLLDQFQAGIDPTDPALLAGAPTIAFNMYTYDPNNAVSYTIKPNDMYDISSITTDTLTDAAGENSVMTADGTTLITVNADDGDDIVIIGAMSSTVTVDGGTGTDILLFTDSNGATDNLDAVTNVEIISLGDATTAITTVDTLVANGASLILDASNLTAGQTLTFDGSAELDGTFTIEGGADADTITGGALNDTITGGAGNDTFNINAGTDTITDLSASDNLVIASGATANANVSANWTATTATQNLGGAAVNANLAVADTVTTVDLSAATVTTASTDGFRISATNDTAAVTITGSTGDDTIIADNADTTNGATITGGAGNDTITLGAGVDTVNVDAGIDSINGIAGNDVLTIASGATANANVSANWTATTATQNLGGAAVNANLAVADTVTTVDLSAATVTTASTDGFRISATNDTAAVTITGSTGDDTIIADNADTTNGATITGGAGNDTITLGAGADTIQIAFGGEGTDVINSFTVAEDIIDFTGTTDVVNVTNSGTLQAVISNNDGTDDAITANSGLVIINNGDAGTGNATSLSTADVATYLAAIDVDAAEDHVDYENTNSVIYLAVSDGTDTAIFKADASGNSDIVIDAAELTLIATLTGIADAGTLTAADFVDFV
ncbi:beta strand repeat-containing protein [Sulfurimonas hydrogeniphila]|uniref:beta strand repeat-containing protein n=1 Tax=Sulfurimonas hydrogeniphila TaxID=2509341 RepID=UPI001E3FF666|nr:hypothetical protein [Sulfurimonas hydrogeniphila]